MGIASLTEWEFFHLLEGYLCDALQIRVVQAGEKLPSNDPRQAVKYAGQNYGRIFDSKQQPLLSFTNAAFHTINNVLNAMHHRNEMQWTNAEDCYLYSLRILKDLEKHYDIQTSRMVDDLENKWELVLKSEVVFSHQNRLLLVKANSLPAFPLEEREKGNLDGVEFIISVPEALTSAQDDIVEHLRELEEIKFISADTSQKGLILCKVAAENEIASILPDFTYRRQKIPVNVAKRFPLTLHPLHESKTLENVRLALKGMDISPMHIHEPDRAASTIKIEVGSKEDADYIIEQGVNMKPQKLTVLQEVKSCPYVVYLPTPVKSQESFKIVWENHFQFLPDPIHFSADLCSAAFLVTEDGIKKIEAGAPTFRILGSKPLIVPYTPYRVEMTFSSPMDKEHLLSALQKIVDTSPLSIYPVFDSSEENPTTFFSAFIHAKDEKAHSALLAKDINIPPFVPSSAPTPTPPSPSRVPPPSPSKNVQGISHNLCFSLPVLEGVSAPDVFTAFKAFGEKGKGKGAWNISFVFDREGTFYVDVKGDPALAQEVKSIEVGGQLVPVKKVEGEVPYYLLQLLNVPATFDTAKILGFFKNEKRRVGQISLVKGSAYVPMAQSDLQAHLKKKFVFIDNVKLEVADASVVNGGKRAQGSKEQVRRAISVNFLQGRLLKKLKDELSEIETAHSVTIRVSNPNPAKPKALKEKDPKKKTDKPKENKNKTEKKTGNDAESVVTVQGKSAEDVSRAIEDLSQNVLEDLKLRPVSLKCKQPQLIQVALPQIKTILRDVSDVSYDLKSDESEIKIMLCGNQATVMLAESNLLALHADLTINESLKIPATFNLDFPALQSEYDVIINHNKQTGKLQVFGTKDCVAQFVDNINSTISSAAQEGVKLERGPFMFLQQCIFSDPQWQAELKTIGAVVTPGANCIMTIKGNDQKAVKSAKQKLMSAKQSINEKKVIKPVPKFLVNVLDRYLKNKLKGTLVTCNSVQDEDSEDDSDDDDASVSSFSSDNSKKKQEKRGKIQLQKVEVVVLYQKPQEGKVAKTLDSLIKKQAEFKKVKYDAEEAATVKTLKLQAVGDKYLVNVFNNIRDKSIVVNGFSQESVQQAFEAVEKMLGRENKDTKKEPKSKEGKAKEGKKEAKEGGKEAKEGGKEAKEGKKEVKDGIGKDVTDAKGKEGKETKEKGKDGKEKGAKGGKDAKGKEGKEGKAGKAEKEGKEGKGGKERKEGKEGKGGKEGKEGKEGKGKEGKDDKTGKGGKEGKEAANESQVYQHTFKPDEWFFNGLFKLAITSKVINLEDHARIFGLLKPPFLNKRDSTIVFTFAQKEDSIFYFTRGLRLLEEQVVKNISVE